MLLPPRAATARHWRLRQATAAVVLLGLAVTAAAVAYVRRSVAAFDRTRFEKSTLELRREIVTRFDAHLRVLLAARGLFYGSEYGVTREELRLFAKSLQLPDADQNVEGIGLARLVTAAELPAHVREMRKSDPHYRVWPEGQRAVYWPVAYFEPESWRSQRELGHDALTMPAWREAMARARDTADPQLSALVRFPLDGDAALADPSMGGASIVCVPIFAAPLPRGPGERRQRIEGFLFTPFDPAKLFRRLPTSAQGSPTIDVEILDHTDAAHRRLLYDSDGIPRSTDPRARGRLTYLEQLSVGGRVLDLFVTTLPAFERDSSHELPYWVAAAGLAFTGLLFTVVQAQARARRSAESAERRAALLAEVTSILSQSMEYEPALATVVRRLIPSFADLVFVQLLEGEAGLRLVALAHGQPHKQELAAEILRRFPLPREASLGTPTVLRTGRPELREQITEEAIQTAWPDEEPRRLAHLLGLRSSIIAPILARGRVLGTISFVLTEPGRRYGSDELALAEELARRAALAIDNARLFHEAQEAVRARDEFIAIASHDLRSPLSSLQIQAQSLLRQLRRGPQPPSLDQVQGRLATIDGQVVRLTRLLDELLDVSRITAGRLSLEPEDVDLAQVVAEVVGRLREEIVRAGCELHIEAHAVIGHWDPLRLEQVVTNLVSNALKYGPQKPVHITVDATDAEARLIVRDHGVGIAREDLQRIFERFERAVSGKRYSGAGLGLWIVRQIVLAMGGRVEVQSELGVGSTFTVVLPRRRAQASQAA